MAASGSARPAGSGASLLFLDPHLLAPNLGWRLGFAIGGVLGLGILLLRRYVPESPRWLVTHGYECQAEETMGDIERRASEDAGRNLPEAKGPLEVHPRRSFGLGLVEHAMLHELSRPQLLGARTHDCTSVPIQCGVLLLRIGADHVLSSSGPAHRALPCPHGISNFLGPLLLGQLFDTVGRRVMISLTYGLGGILLIAAAAAFALVLLSQYVASFSRLMYLARFTFQHVEGLR